MLLKRNNSVGANGIRPINDIIIKNTNNIQRMYCVGYAWANAIRPRRNDAIIYLFIALNSLNTEFAILLNLR